MAAGGNQLLFGKLSQISVQVVNELYATVGSTDVDVNFYNGTLKTGQRVLMIRAGFADHLFVVDKKQIDSMEDLLDAESHETTVGEVENDDDHHPTSKSQSTSTPNFRWTHESTLLLVETFRDHKKLFESACLKKVEVWKKVANDMCSHGYQLSWEACEKKMRNLKYRYKIITDSSGKSGRGRCQWEFMDAMTQLMSGDPCVQPVHLLGSLPTTVPSTVTSAGSGHLPEKRNCGVPPASVASTSTSSDVIQSETPAKKQNKNKRKAERNSELFEFFAEQRSFMQEAIGVMKETVTVARERNSLLRELTDALKREN